MKTILLVEDDPLSANRLQAYLQKRGHTVLTAGTVRQAIRLLTSRKDIDTAVVDLVLPVEDDEPPQSTAGIRLVTDIRKLGHDVRIIVNSAFVEKYAEKLLNLGVDYVVSKSSADWPLTLERVIRNATTERHRPIPNTTRSQQALQHLKSALAKELDKFARVKEQTVSIPREGSYELIKPLIGFRRDIERQLARHPFAQNVFLMLKYRDSNCDLSTFIQETLATAGLKGVRADQPEWNITGNVYNPIAALYCCKYGIALFDEPEEHQAYSPNVAYELGMMHYQGKNCLILRHETLPAVPFDLIKDLHVPYTK